MCAERSIFDAERDAELGKARYAMNLNEDTSQVTYRFTELFRTNGLAKSENLIKVVAASLWLAGQVNGREMTQKKIVESLDMPDHSVIRRYSFKLLDKLRGTKGTGGGLSKEDISFLAEKLKETIPRRF